MLGILVLPASAQADPVRAQACTLKLKRSGAQTAKFSFMCNYPINNVLARTNKLATVTPPFFTTGAAPSFSCVDPFSGPGDPIQAVAVFPNSFACVPIAFSNRAQGTLRTADPCGRRPLRVTDTWFNYPIGAVITRDVEIQGCPAERPPRPPRPPEPPEPPEPRCTITGSPATNVIRGTSGDDVICARGGNDVVYAREGNDIVRGEAGDDVLRGQADRDELFGGPGRDNCHTDREDTQHNC